MNRGGSAKERLILGTMAAGAAIAGARQGRLHRKAAIAMRGFYKATGCSTPQRSLHVRRPRSQIQQLSSGP